MADIQKIVFQGDQISTCRDERTGKVYCVPREICERLGVEWSTQRRKLQSQVYQKHMGRVHMNTPSGEQEVVLLNVDLLPTWLLSISAEKVHPAIKDKLLAYQEECAQVLRDYWFKGYAVHPSLRSDPYAEQHAYMGLLSVAVAFLDGIGQLDERTRLMFADRVRTRVLQSPGEQKLLAEPKEVVFFVADRVSTLGYVLAARQEAVHMPALGKRIAAEYRGRYNSNPMTAQRYVDGKARPVNVYKQEDVEWIDVIIQSYFSRQGLRRTVAA
jgi:hypothetical protein